MAEGGYKLPQFVCEDARQLDLYDILGVSIMVGRMFGGTDTWKLSIATHIDPFIRSLIRSRA